LLDCYFAKLIVLWLWGRLLRKA